MSEEKANCQSVFRLWSLVLGVSCLVFWDFRILLQPRSRNAFRDKPKTEGQRPKTMLFFKDSH